MVHCMTPLSVLAEARLSIRFGLKSSLTYPSAEVAGASGGQRDKNVVKELFEASLYSFLQNCVRGTHTAHHQ